MSQDDNKHRHSIRGHLRSVGIALIFGLGAYAMINMLIFLSRSMGSKL